MKFAICNETFQDWPHDKAFEFASDIGYEGIEIAPFTLAPTASEVTTAERDRIKGLAEQNELHVIGLHWLLAKTNGFYLTTPDATVRKKTALYLGELAQLCHDLGGRIMVLGSPMQRNLLPGITHEQGMDFAADVLRQVVPKLEELNVTIAVEPLSPQEGDFLNTAALGSELCQKVESSFCRLHLDVKAMSSETTPIPTIIRQQKQLLEHFHANDPNLRGPGMGEMDFVPILESLIEVDYRGWVSVEVFDYAPGPEALAEESIAYLESCLGKLRGE